MRANTHVTLVVDNTAPQTQRSKCATSPQPFLTDQHPIYGGKAEVVRTQQSGGYWHFRMWISRRGVDTDSLRRSIYSDDEYSRITRVLISYTSKKAAQREFSGDDELFIRQLVRHLFLIGANTMMRFGELYQLKWGNVETYTV
jgi:hypothetical protein